MHGWPVKTILGYEDKLYPQVMTDLTFQKGLLPRGSRLATLFAMQKRYWERYIKDTKESRHAENERNNQFGGRV